ncbi:MAG: hypothetical protein KAT70_08835, partial [Thermoplasmata archaeon]|nr:hypothetical protein [Thermoplasmata archaeon]
MPDDMWLAGPKTIVDGNDVLWITVQDISSRHQADMLVTSTEDGAHWAPPIEVGGGGHITTAFDGSLFISSMDRWDGGLSTFFISPDGEVKEQRLMENTPTSMVFAEDDGTLSLYFAAGSIDENGQVVDNRMYHSFFSNEGWGVPSELFRLDGPAIELAANQADNTIQWTIYERYQALVYSAPRNGGAPTLADVIPLGDKEGGSRAPPLATKEWTFAVYLDGDNNLEQAAIDDFLEMSSIGSDANVNIVAQFDRHPWDELDNPDYSSEYDNWATCKRYYITNGMVPNATNALEDLGEADMGESSTLENFFTWTIDNYPADKFMFVLWDHGDGWNGGCCVDQTSYDRLYNDELKSALQVGREHLGRPIDVIGFDACLMGDAAVAYSCKAGADYFTASEETEGWDGWNYATILGNLVGDPTCTPETIGGHICFTDPSIVTISHVNLTTFDSQLMPAVNNLAQKLRHVADMFNPQIDGAVLDTQDFYNDYAKDLRHFVTRIQWWVPNIEVQTACTEVLNVWDATVP